jgi:DNA repair protein SbcD/Mre11
MRLLHVSDWHLGRNHGAVPRREDLADVLEQTVAVAREFRPDVILHSGDLFDGPRPAVDDLQLACDTLRELRELAPAVVLTGNHDSPQLLRFLDGLVAPGRLRFVDVVRRPAEGGILDYEVGGGQRVRIAPLPFVSAHRMVRAFEDPGTWTSAYADRIRAIMGVLAEGLATGAQPDRDVHVFAAHVHVTGAQVTHSERPYTVSDGYAAQASALPPVAYAAFGHIHRAQILPQASVTGRYAGSPIPLDFGEEHDTKVCLLVEADPGRPAVVTEHGYTIRRPLWRFSGTIAELRDQAASVGTALCQVAIHTEEPALELAAQVAELLPEAVLLSVEEVCAARQTEALQLEDLPDEVEPPLEELFQTFVGERGVSASTVDEVTRTFGALREGSELPDLTTAVTPT